MNRLYTNRHAHVFISLIAQADIAIVLKLIVQHSEVNECNILYITTSKNNILYINTTSKTNMLYITQLQKPMSAQRCTGGLKIMMKSHTLATNSIEHEIF